jgi:hypothetical protein
MTTFQSAIICIAITLSISVGVYAWVMSLDAEERNSWKL